MLLCRLHATAPALAEDTLALVSFGHSFGATSTAAADPREVRVALPHLAGPAYEHWTVKGRVERGRDDDIGWARNDQVLFGQIAPRDREPYARQIEDAYARIVSFVRAQGYPQLLRCWNYFGGIHEGEGDAERYRQFCAGRHRELAKEAGFETKLPAATVIGSNEPGTLIYFFASRVPGLQIENPRQVSAFRYPREYAPLPPSFSRAVLKRWGDEPQLFVSGTASVVGHATRHPGDAPAQLREALANLRALLDAAAQASGDAKRIWKPVALKAYVRERASLAATRALLEEVLGPDAPVLYLQGDICRTDLAVEVEGLYK